MKSLSAGSTLRIEWGTKLRTLNVKAQADLPAQKLQDLEDAVNAWLATHAEEGELIRVHIYSLKPLDYVVQRWANAKLSDIGDGIPADWWTLTR